MAYFPKLRKAKDKGVKSGDFGGQGLGYHSQSDCQGIIRFIKDFYYYTKVTASRKYIVLTQKKLEICCTGLG
jgi:hypothetical protein